MREEKTSFDIQANQFSKLLEEVYEKGYNEEKVTVHEILNDLTDKLGKIFNHK